MFKLTRLYGTCYVTDTLTFWVRVCFMRYKFDWRGRLENIELGLVRYRLLPIGPLLRFLQ